MPRASPPPRGRGACRRRDTRRPCLPRPSGASPRSAETVARRSSPSSGRPGRAGRAMRSGTPPSRSCARAASRPRPAHPRRGWPRGASGRARLADRRGPRRRGVSTLPQRSALTRGPAHLAVQPCAARAPTSALHGGGRRLVISAVSSIGQTREVAAARRGAPCGVERGEGRQRVVDAITSARARPSPMVSAWSRGNASRPGFASPPRVRA